MSDFLIKIRYAARTLLRSPGFTVTAVVAIALGIGANTAIFSVVNKVLLEPLPYPDPGRLVQLISSSPLGDQYVVSIPKYITWRDNTHGFEYMAAYESNGLGVTLAQGDSRQALKAARVTPDYFPLFGAKVAFGRIFSIDEDRPGGPRVVVIKHELWVRRFGSDSNLAGRSILLNNERHKVVGILAPGFIADPPADVWLPLRADPQTHDHISRVRVAARIKPGITRKDADEQVMQTWGRFNGRYPYAPTIPWEHFAAIPLRDAVVGDTRGALFLLMGAVAFVLLISCANVANLLLARSARRVREIAIRSALGAARKQLVRQLLTESVLLSLVGGALGLAAGYFGVRELLALSPGDIPRIGANGAAIGLDWRVFLFTLIVSLLTGVVFGLMPALHASRPDISSLVKDNTSQSGMGLRRNRGRAALAISEVALALVLLAGAGLLIRTFVAMRTVDRGFDERNVLTLQMPLNGPLFERTAQVAQLVRNTEKRLRRIPSVATVAATSALPLERSLSMPFLIIGHDRFRYDGAALWYSVSPRYFDAFRIRLLRGRVFDENDGEHGAPVMLINRIMWRKFWPEVDGNPIGRFVRIDWDAGFPRQIVGVVADVRDAGLNKEPMMYVPVAQVSDGLNERNNQLLPITWVVRTSGTMLPPMAEIQHEIQEAAGGVPTERIRTMHEVVAASSARTQFYMMLLSVFAGIALLLAAVGIYGLMAYSVQQRTQEIGIRMALGADHSDVRNMVVAQGMRLALLGIAVGIPTALALTRVMSSMIFGIETWDPAVFGIVAVLLCAVTFFATFVPSLRATRVDPVEALRN
jgi:putative ABC transport system permease protein